MWPHRDPPGQRLRMDWRMEWCMDWVGMEGVKQRMDLTVTEGLMSQYMDLAVIEVVTL